MDIIVDLHCHPSMKPFGRSFSANQQHNVRSTSPANVWYHDRPSIIDKAVNYAAQLTKFRQSDFTSSRMGRVRVIVASLYPQEQGFFVNRLGSGPVGDIALALATGVGQRRIQVLQQLQDYFPDLQDEYKFLLELDGKSLTLPTGEKVCYRLCGTRADVEIALQEPNTLAVLLSIEGAHAFGCGLDFKQHPTQKEKLLNHIQQVKAWRHRPLFITFAHHFYNELGGHAASLTGLVARLADQSYGMTLGLTDLGHAVLRELLDNTGGRRILIDVKHMNRRSRQDYYQLLDNEYAGQDIPIIASHGAVTGNAADHHLFWDFDINFYDDDLLRIARSGGLLGLQLDERRVGSPAALRKARGHLPRRKILFHWAGLVWNQVRHVAELLDSHGLYSWGSLALGTDFDGIVDPINGYWTHEQLPALSDYLLMHAHNYLGDRPPLTQAVNRAVSAEEVISRIMADNAMAFLLKYLPAN
ncbi:membrane dipeptidase [Hymenobacter volaticus]|uniref:Membrane dipeptidase n=1 Tax=Hymenobacter volaticus TaxID=2932254 RepID=A0ABY4GDW6_9BACT|nr:membrane dipeptidase [Hymenobacter volaticus]UOQ69048.1 membrane dipeptidase [Hymenobacter volaticus]